MCPVNKLIWSLRKTFVLGAVLLRFPRSDISPRYDKLTNGRVVYSAKVQLVHLGSLMNRPLSFILFHFIKDLIFVTFGILY